MEADRVRIRGFHTTRIKAVRYVKPGGGDRNSAAFEVSKRTGFPFPKPCQAHTRHWAFGAFPMTAMT